MNSNNWAIGIAPYHITRIVAPDQTKTGALTIKKIIVLVFVSLSLLVTVTTDNSFGQTKTRNTKTDKKINGLLKELKESQEGPERVDILGKLCVAYKSFDPGKAMYYGRQGLELSKKSNYQKGIASAYDNIGIIYTHQGHYANALEYYFKSLKIKEELGDAKGIASSYNNIGVIYKKQGHYANALEYYFKSLKIREELGDAKGIAICYNNIGVIYHEQGNYPLASEHFFNSLKIDEELGNRRGIATRYNNIGIVYIEQGNYPLALEYLFKSLKISEQLGDQRGMTTRYLNIGKVYSDQGDYSLALEYYFKSLKISEKLGYKRKTASNYNGIARIYQNQGNYPLALEYYFKSLKINEELGNNKGLSQAYLGIGLCYTDTKEGLDYLTRALKLAQTINQADTINEAAGELSQAYAKIKQFDRAYQYHVLFKEKSDELKNKEKDKKITQLAMQYEFDKKQQQVQIELDKRKNLIIAFIVSSVLLVLLLFFIYSRFRLKKKANITIQAEKEKAVKANRAKSEFLANMSHELRTPLNAVIGFSELLFSMAVDQKQKSYTQSIRTAGKSLLTLINDILDLSKIESGMMGIKYAPVNPIMIFNEIEEIFHEKLARKNLTYITDIDEALPETLFLDETRLRQILLNLVGNAVKFTSDGHIKLSAKQGNETNQPGQIDLVISVEDTGIGIPPQEQERIFQPFQQQSGQSIRKYGGTGLGLSICKRLTQMMKGRISVESQPGKGSCFKLMLENVTVPSAEVVTAREDESFNLDSITFEPARVLVVDDVESNRAMLEEMLPRVNLEVLTAKNGQEALRFALEYLPDVIVMDIVMPVMDGYEAANALKSNPRTKDIPVLVLSASSSGEQKQKILESGFFAAYLEKPVDVNQLFKELSNYIHYSRTTVSTPPGVDEQNHIKDLPQETLRRIPELIRVLQEDMLPLIENFKGALKTEEVKKFSDKIKQLGEDFAVPGLINYANRLNEFEQDFDIEGIEKSLADFPTIVKNLVFTYGCI